MGDYTDADDVFQARVGMTVSEFVATQMDEFRRVETEILSEFVADKRSGNHVVSLGGGVVETEAARALLKKHVASGGAVVHVTRGNGCHRGGTSTRSAQQPFGRHGASPSPRCGSAASPGLPIARAMSSSILSNRSLASRRLTTTHRAMKAECRRFFRFIAGLERNRPDVDESGHRPTSFVCLTFPTSSPRLSLSLR